MKRWPIIVLGLALALGITASAVIPVRAGAQLSISPSFLYLEGADAADGVITVQVANHGDESIELVAEVGAYDGIDGEYSAVPWIAVEPGRLLLEPGASIAVEVAVSIPAGVEAGGRYAALTLTTAAPVVQEGTQAVSGRIVVPIWLAVDGEGDLTRAPRIERFAPFLEADGRIGFRAAVHNDGNVHARVAGAVEVDLGEGDATARLELKGRAILPDGTHVFATDGTLPLPAGERYAAVASIFPAESADPDEFEHVQATADFTTAPLVSIDATSICENLDRGPSVVGTVKNDGDLGLLPRVRFEILDAGGRPVAFAEPASSPIAWPHDQLDVSADVSQRLASGDYTLVTQVTFGAGEQIQHDMPFSIGGDPTTAAPLCANPTLG